MAGARRGNRSGIIRRQELPEKQILEIVAEWIRPRVRTGRRIRKIASGQVGLRYSGRENDIRMRRRR